MRKMAAVDETWEGHDWEDLPDDEIAARLLEAGAHPMWIHWVVPAWRGGGRGCGWARDIEAVLSA